ncbi:hypothetical protein B0H11DRAFT_2296738 [Mycena galericulata]|nr:hypothetical protein B0H11DRAFT_2296738 [Mycena galericulata]
MTAPPYCTLIFLLGVGFVGSSPRSLYLSHSPTIRPLNPKLSVNTVDSTLSPDLRRLNTSVLIRNSNSVPLPPYRYTPSCRSSTCSFPTTSCLPVIIHVRSARYHSIAQTPRPIFLHASISNPPAPLHVPKTLSPAPPTGFVSLLPQVDAGAVLQKETTPIPQMHMIPTPRIAPILPSTPNSPLSPPSRIEALNLTASAPSTSYSIPRALPSPPHPTSFAKELLQRVTAQTDADAYYKELARMSAMRPSFGSAVCVPMEAD